MLLRMLINTFHNGAQRFVGQSIDVPDSYTSEIRELQEKNIAEQQIFTVATLPAASLYKGARKMVSDANATTFWATVAGGGSNIIVVTSDGTNWKIG
jgi:hypothetical protein